GTPQEAAGWVADSLAKGYNVKYWEIGNECYGSWEYDINVPEHDPLEYANRAIQYIAAMKQADPTARVGVVLALGEDNYPSTHIVTNPVTNQTHSGWDAVVLSTLAAANVTPDFVIYHRYEQNENGESDTGLMQAAAGWVAASNTMQAELNDYLGANASKVEMLNTENNSISSGPGKQSVSLVNGLYMADSLGYISQSAFNAWIWWDLYNGSEVDGNLSAAIYGWRQYGDYGIVEQPGNGGPLLYFPTYYVAKILSHFARGGDQVVSCTSSLSQLLDVFAAKRADGSLSLLIVNKSIPTATNPSGLSVTGNFTINGFSGATTATQYQYGVPQDNQAESDTNNNIDPGTDAAADVQTSTVNIAGATFTMSFPAASVTLLSIPAAQQPTGTARLINLSSLGLVQGTTNEMVGGFVVGGSGTEEVLIRGIGPALSGFGISSPVANVNLTVNDGAGNPIATNNGWSSGTAQNTQQLQAAFGQTGAFSLAAGSMDSAVLMNLGPGNYTAVINGVGGASGTGMVEIYEVSSSGTRLLNLSSRAYVDNGANILTGGLTIGGTGAEKVIIRGIGPTLANFNQTSFVADPALKVIPAGGSPISASDDWSDSTDAGLAAAFQSVGAFALTPMSRDAAVLLTLPVPSGSVGRYTAQVYATDGNSGTGLVEVYEVPSP
ncbi:MAG TPA: hypothetical protein VFE31_16270, partial [Opitutaceae bacterium]|nr:hypothetical protein [Opitutaceae bacterium]